MSREPSIEDVNELIEQHSDKAREAIGKLPDYCQQDRRCRTPLNVAIQSHNQEIVGLLSESDEAVNFCPQIDEDLLKPARYSAGSMFRGDNVEETENYLTQSFGPRTCFQRSPLHTACRYANSEAIALLISKNAKLDAKDILGLTPLELCIQFGGAAAIDRLVGCCVEAKRKLRVTELALKTSCADTALYQQLIKHGTLDVKAKRFAFNLSCALLDKDGVSDWLEQGLDINKAINDELSPIREICTSQMLLSYGHPEAPRLAGQYAAAQSADAGGIHISNDDILNAESLEELEALFSSASKQSADKGARQTSYDLSDEERVSQLSQRLALIDFLVDHGLDIDIAKEKAPFNFVDDVLCVDSPELVQALVDKGFSLRPEGVGEPATAVRAKPVKAVTRSKWTWELSGESVLLAETEPGNLTHGKPAIVRLTHNNVYGPVDGVDLFVRCGDEWHPMVPVEELLYVDGEEVERSSVKEPLTVETPWTCTYECELKPKRGKQAIEIKIDSDIEGMAAVISDWVVSVR